MTLLARTFANLFGGWGRLRRWFPAETMARIRDAIAAGETGHGGEICFAVETRLSLVEVLERVDARTRAHQVFAELGVWNTADNGGVLIYALLAERRVEIVADRGVSARVDASAWQGICDLVVEGFRGDDPARGVLAAIAALHSLLAASFPAVADNVCELPDDPVIL